MNKYWFIPKGYGYGFVPITWEGWVATAILLGIVFLSGLSNGVIIFEETPEALANIDVAGFTFDLIIALSIFTLTMKDKTKGVVRWRWGN